MNTNLNVKSALVLFIALDVFCVAAGMGVPIFAILLGFPAGWYITKNLTGKEQNLKNIFGKIFKYSVVTSAVTLLAMTIIWGRMIPMIFNPETDFKNIGIPFILYEPKISFIGWLALMIAVSPFLQLLATVFTACLTLMKRIQKNDSYNKVNQGIS